jgi:predicted RNase H-like nuclease (RuvC/YqgF family)
MLYQLSYRGPAAERRAQSSGSFSLSRGMRGTLRHPTIWGMEENAQRPRAGRRRRRQRRAPDVCVEVRVISAQSAETAEALDEAPVPADTTLPEAVPPLPPDGILAEGERRHLETRAKRLSEQEEALRSRVVELDRRDEALSRREAELEAAFGFREDRIEQRETELAEAQVRLERREQELNNYVTRLQAEFARRS